MNDDKFNYDDDLPDWLKDDDDQPQDADSSSQAEWDIPDTPQGPSSASPSPSLGVTGELPWRQDVSGPSESPGQRSSIDNLDWGTLDSDDLGDMFAAGTDDDASSMDWMTDDSFESTAAPSDSAPDWLTGPSDTDDYASVGDFSQPQSEPQFASTNDTFDLDDFDSMFEETPAQLSADDASSTDDSLDWLSEEPMAAGSSADDDVDLLDFLFDEDFPASDESPTPDSEPSGVIRRLADTPPVAAPEPPQLRRLSEAQPQPPAPQPPPEEPRRIRKLSEVGRPPSEDELTFEEWERQQHQAQFEEEHAEDLALEAEVPDWFQDNVKIGDAADEIASLLIPEEDLPDTAPQSTDSASGVSGTYVPEWFMGLEEQNLDEAPDWVRDAASGRDALSSLTDVSAFAPPEPEPEPEPPQPSAPQFSMEGDVPDWFAGIDAGLGLGDVSASDADWMSSFAAPPAEPQPSVSADFDLPDLTASAPLEEPDWMADMAVPDAGAMSFEEADDADFASLFGDDLGAEPDLFPLETSAEDEPDWMADMATIPEPDVSPSRMPPTRDSQIDTDSPSWLQGYEAPEITQEEPDLFADQKIDTELAWLGDVESVDFSDAFASDAGAGVAKGQSAKKPTTDELIASADVSNLADLFGAESSLVPAGATDNDLFSSVDGIDDLFDGVDESLFETFTDTKAPPTPSSTSSAATVDDGETMVYEAEGPDWVQELRPDLQVKLNIGGLNVEFDQQGVNQLPPSLQSLRDQTRSVVQSAPKDTDEALATQGPLAGIKGGISISPIATAIPSELELTTQTTIPGHQAKQIDILEEALAIAYEAGAILIEPDFDELEGEVAPAPTPAPIAKKRRAKRKLDRLFISLILLAALLAPFASEAFHFAEEPDTTALAAEQQLVVAAVTDLEPGDYVLLAFEYGPTAAGELNALAEAILRDILSQRAIPIIISTNPLGALNGRGVLEQLAADEDLLNALERDEHLVAGQDYFALRYISGGAVAIRSLSQSETLAAFVFSTDNTGEDTGLDFGELGAEDFALAFVIGESIDDIRNWAEQFDVPDLPKFTLVTAAAEPLVGAYVDSDGDSAYWGYLAGYRDTYRYNQLRNQRTLSKFKTPDDIDIPDPDISQWHSMAFGALVAGLLVILGMVFNTLRNTRRRRRV